MWMTLFTKSTSSHCSPNSSPLACVLRQEGTAGMIHVFLLWIELGAEVFVLWLAGCQFFTLASGWKTYQMPLLNLRFDLCAQGGCGLCAATLLLDTGEDTRFAGYESGRSV